MPIPLRTSARPPLTLGVIAGALLVAAAAFPPAIAVVSDLLHRFTSAPAPDAPAIWIDVPLLAKTLFNISLIAGVSTLLAYPAAWTLRAALRRRRAALLLGALAAPLVLPNYLPYAGLGLIRSPRTAIGDWLIHQGDAAITYTNYALALLGVSLWLWPVATALLTASISTVPDSLFESAALDGARRRDRSFLRLRLALPGLLFAFAVTALLALGSAVPLHVADVPTYAIHLWRILNVTQDKSTVWPAALPLMIVGAIAAITLLRAGRPLQRLADDEIETTSPRRPAGALFFTTLTWCLAVLVPLVMCLWAMHDAGRTHGSFATLAANRAFWRECSEATRETAFSALIAASLAGVVLLGTWAGFASSSRFPRALAAAGLFILTIMTALPGVLVGTALAEAWNASAAGRTLADSLFALPLAHLARFGGFAAIAGWLLALSESPSDRAQRLLDGGHSLRAWWSASVLRSLPSLAGSLLLIAALCAHEIEATVLVIPPGVPSLPQLMLESLHFARDDRLAAAMINISLAGAALSLTIGALVNLTLRRSLEARAPRDSSPGPASP